MKDSKLFFLALLPLVGGYLYVHFVVLPFLGTPILLIMPVLFLIYWYWVGEHFASTGLNPVWAVLYGNIFGIISFGCYYWHLFGVPVESRSFELLTFLGAFSSPVETLIIKVCALFGRPFGEISDVVDVQLNFAGLLLMMAVFILGYIVGKQRIKKAAA